MKIKRCCYWRGGDRFGWRVWLPGNRDIGFVLHSDRWDRKGATEALDYIERFYGINRRNVRWVEIS
jgi:hypothetical protein